MDFSVGIAVLVLVTVLVVAVIGYGIYLNRRHDQWENVVGHAASDAKARGPDVSKMSASQRSPAKRVIKSPQTSRGSSHHTVNKKQKRAQNSAKSESSAKTPQRKVGQAKILADTPELPHMSIEEVYKGGISTGGVPVVEGIIKHEIKGKRADVFGANEDTQTSVDTTFVIHEHMAEASMLGDKMRSSIDTSDSSENSTPPLLEGIVGEVVTKPREEAQPTIASGRRWTTENNAHVLQSEKTKSSRISTRSRANERIVPLRKGSTKILSNGASKARQKDTNSSSEQSRLEEYVVLRVSGKHTNAFPLRELARFMLNRSLKFDNTGLFSMHDEDTNELMFKVADVYSPGQFDRAQIETYCTEGLTFIMCLAPLSNPQQSFEQMLSLASECARCFDAVVQDEHSNKLSNQTITHYRYRVADFRRKQMSM
ncbi:MAG: hypothetical protein F4227_04470 [Gammaproteobacteria bacterium]|nr:hypothetical protein [Gammaproteobacteria bacterium]MYF02227.1 hypothetical protein [Gammaproteobacteria bacterium]MYI77060.1 hypothetical protein [Gammaproteobacteria bacterium]